MIKILKKQALQIAVVCSLGMAAFGIGISPASAAGTGPSTNNCFGQYWNTAWAQKCGKAALPHQDGSNQQQIAAPHKLTILQSKSGGKKNGTSYSGKACMFGIHTVLTWHRAG